VQFTDYFVYLPLSGEADAGNAEEQPARNSLTQIERDLLRPVKWSLTLLSVDLSRVFFWQVYRIGGE